MWTRARTFLREHKAKTGESLSFTAFLTACLAKAVDEHKAVQAFRQGGKRLILFEEVDVYTLIERDVAGQKQPMPSHRQSRQSQDCAREIHQEIRAAQVQDIEKDLKWLQFLPALLFGPFFWVFSWIRTSFTTGVEEVRGDGGHHGRGHVLGKVQVGVSLQPSQHSS